MLSENVIIVCAFQDRNNWRLIAVRQIQPTYEDDGGGNTDDVVAMMMVVMIMSEDDGADDDNGCDDDYCDDNDGGGNDHDKLDYDFDDDLKKFESP